jgi:hypothetical protein
MQMVRPSIVAAVLLLGAAPALAQKEPGISQAPAVSHSPFAHLLPPRANANRTIEVLRAAGILNVRTDSPFTLSARTPYLDPQTFMTLDRSSLYPDRNVIVMNRADLGLDRSSATVHWFGNPDRRYVVDCAFASGTGTVRFDWSEGAVSLGDSSPHQDDVPIVNGRAAIVLPTSASSSVRIAPREATEMSSCDVTPFGE